MIGCKEKSKQGISIGYDLDKAAVFKMPAVLDEISGIAFKNGNADTIFAEQDEEGKLFYFHQGDNSVSHTKFAKKGDYEDLVICNGYLVVLRSDGVFYSFPLTGIFHKDAENVSEQTGLLPEGEYESLYADESNGSLYVLCKNCSIDKSGQTISGYVLQLGSDGKLQLKNNFEVTALEAGKNIRLKPSALSRNPITREWFIVSSVNKVLMVTDSNWKPVKLYKLNPVLFTQPEGIAFDKTGNLYISNEKGEGLNGSILEFLYKN